MSLDTVLQMFLIFKSDFLEMQMSQKLGEFPISVKMTLGIIVVSNFLIKLNLSIFYLT